MRTYRYLYQDNDGKMVRSRIKADNAPHARSLLREKQIIPISVREEKDLLRDDLFSNKSVSDEDIMVFAQLFSSTIRCGLSIKETLKILSKQMGNRILRNRLSEILYDLESGTPLSASFAKHLDVIPDYFPLLIKAGEVSGDIAGVLDYIEQYIDRMQGLKKELVGVFTYPAIVFSIAVALMLLILIFVAPKFVGIFAKSKIPLPIPTKILFFMSDILLTHAKFIIFCAVMSLGLGLYLVKSAAGRAYWDKISFKIPGFGKIVRQVNLLRMVRTFDILVNNNVPILQVLKVLEESTPNSVIRAVIVQMRKDVSRGLPIADALVRSDGIVSPVVAHTISMGEKSGSLGQALSRISVFLDKELNFTIKKFSSRIDPMLTLGLGVMVLYIALSIYLPIFDMTTTMGLK